MIDNGCQTKNLNFWIKTSFIHKKGKNGNGFVFYKID